MIHSRIRTRTRIKLIHHAFPFLFYMFFFHNNLEINHVFFDLLKRHLTIQFVWNMSDIWMTFDRILFDFSFIKFGYRHSQAQSNECERTVVETFVDFFY